jgi:sugar lactone lactonase YvrE
MLDKYAWVREALPQPDGSYQLQPRPLAHLGPGRPLGAGFDADGNLIICDALKVRAGQQPYDWTHVTPGAGNRGPSHQPSSLCCCAPFPLPPSVKLAASSCGAGAAADPSSSSVHRCLWPAQGLVMLEKDTMDVRVLANRVAPTSPTHAGMPLIYTNDLDIASDGTVYFTTSINVYPHRCAAMLAGRAGGCCKHTLGHLKPAACSAVG